MALIYGAEKSAAPEKNLVVVEGFAACLDVLSYDQEAAAHSGQLRAELAKNGKPIGPYEQMIAGHTGEPHIGRGLNYLAQCIAKTGVVLDDRDVDGERFWGIGQEWHQKGIV